MEEENEEGKPENKEMRKKSDDEEGLLDVVRENPWVAATVVLGVVVVIMLFGSFLGTGNVTGHVVSESEAGDAIVKIVNSQGADAELISVDKEFGLYNVIFSVDGRESSVYVTLDGKNIINGLIPLESLKEQEPSEQYFTEEQNALIQEFSDCLYNSGMRIYYAGWCGHCHNLIETFGGLDNMGEMMIECQTANQQPGTGAELCKAEEIRGFPTIKINGEQYSGARNFEAFAEVTECEVPAL
jgi:thiol-disulfide isomerase/thioredoxin